MRVFTNICNKYAVFSNYGNKKGVILETKEKKTYTDKYNLQKQEQVHMFP